MNPENPNRLQVQELISALPGSHLRMLSRFLGVSLSTIRYHVLNLERDGEISCWREGEYLRVYPYWITDQHDWKVYAVLQRKPARKILRALLEGDDGHESRTTNGGISTITHLSKSTVSEYLGIFRGLGLAKKVPTMEGRAEFAIEEAEKERVWSILNSLERSFLSKATDSYVTLWDF